MTLHSRSETARRRRRQQRPNPSVIRRCVVWSAAWMVSLYIFYLLFLRPWGRTPPEAYDTMDVECRAKVFSEWRQLILGATGPWGILSVEAQDALLQLRSTEVSSSSSEHLERDLIDTLGSTEIPSIVGAKVCGEMVNLQDISHCIRHHPSVSHSLVSDMIGNDSEGIFSAFILIPVFVVLFAPCVAASHHLNPFLVVADTTTTTPTYHHHHSYKH